MRNAEFKPEQTDARRTGVNGLFFDRIVTTILDPTH